MTIPRFFHFVFGLKKQTEPFSLYHYLCLESCRQVNKPEAIYFHYQNMPYGPYWDRIKDHLELVPAKTNAFMANYRYSWKNRACAQYKYAHHSDFIRLEQLFERGGVYADIDSIFVNPIPDELFEHDFVLGREDDVVDQGTMETRSSLCNALIMSKPGSTFCKLWLDGMYDGFNGTWSAHSTLLPWTLSQENPDLIHVEPSRTFYPFMWTTEDLHLLFKGCDTALTDVASIHLWAHLWHSAHRTDFSSFHAGMLTEEFIRHADTTYTLLARPYLPPNPEADSSLKISTLIPTFDRSEEVFDAVSSVLSQSIQPHEIILIDDGSSPEHARKYVDISRMSAIIRLHRLEQNLGRSAARNAALDLAQGEFIHFLDDDDRIHPQFYENGLQVLSDTDIDCAVCRSAFFSDQSFSPGDDNYVTQPMDSRLLERDPELFILSEPLAINAVLCRASAMEGARFDANLSIGEDTFFWLKVVRRARNWKAITFAGAFVRIHDGNTRKQCDFQDHQDRYLEVLAGHDRSKEGLVRASINLQRIRNNVARRRLPSLCSMLEVLAHPIQSSSMGWGFLTRLLSIRRSLLRQKNIPFIRR